METIRQEAIDAKTKSSDDVNPYVGVSDNHLLVSSRPTKFGVFAASAGDLPTQPARWFRLTNSGSGAVTVNHRYPILKKYFDGDSLEVSKDSGTILLTNPSISTPNGTSNALKINHTADNSAYAHIPSPYGLKENHTVTNYFKIESNASELQPLGLYSNYGGIDINHPAVGLRITSTNEVKIRVGTNVTDTSVSHTPNSWYRVKITALSASAKVVMEKFNPSTKLWAVEVNETVASSGVGLISELLSKDEYVVAFASEGVGVQYIDNFEVLEESSSGEVLPVGATKEYDCNRTLDEYSVDGAVTGYWRG